MYFHIKETTIECPYGWIIKIDYRYWFLLFVITVFLCSGSILYTDLDLHPDDTIRENEVTMTVIPGLLSIDTMKFYDTNWYLVISNSTVPIDIEAQNLSGQFIFSLDNLMPTSYFWYYPEEPSRIIAAAG